MTRLFKVLALLAFVLAALLPGDAQAAIHDSGLPYASVRYQADRGTNYILAYNHKTNYGRYVVMSESENVYFSFDFNPTTKEFTMYSDNGSVTAVRRMLSWDRMECHETSGTDGIYTRQSDGRYCLDGASYNTYERAPKAFNIILEKNGDLGGESSLPYAKVSYQADRGTNYILAYNHKTKYGRYVVLSESENVYFSFDFNPTTKEFTMYSDNGSVTAVRRMLSWDRMECHETSGTDGIYTRESDGRYCLNGASYNIYERAPKAFNIILERNGDLT